MQYLKPEDVCNLIFDSWIKSKQNNLVHPLNAPKKAKYKEYTKTFNENKKLIKNFKLKVNEISKLLQKEYIFIITNQKLILLELVITYKEKEQIFLIRE